MFCQQKCLLNPCKILFISIKFVVFICRPSQFYLVLDISNLTAQEMSLNYTNNKNILIEAKESCRVPIPVDRCSLEDVWAAREAEIAENLEKGK